MDLRNYFREACNKRRIHIEQLRIIRDQKEIDAATRRKLNNKIAYERRQLAIITETWTV